MDSFQLSEPSNLQAGLGVLLALVHAKQRGFQLHDAEADPAESRQEFCNKTFLTVSSGTCSGCCLKAESPTPLPALNASALLPRLTVSEHDAGLINRI